MDHTPPQALQGQKGDVRAECLASNGAKCSGIPEQIDCLIDQATDLAILGRTYVGWHPFL